MGGGMHEGTQGDLTFVEVGAGAERRRIAVKVREGSGPPVVWLGGFRSDMGATKAMAVDGWAMQM